MIRSAHSRLLPLLAFMLIAASAATLPADDAANPSPQQIVDQAGLTRMGFLFVLPDEADIRTGADAVRHLKQRVANETGMRRNLEKEIADGNQKISLLDTAIQTTGAKTQSQPNNNALIIQYNSMVSARDQLGRRITDLSDQLEKMNSSQSTYITKALELSDKVEAAAAHYAELAKDPRITAAIAALATPGRTPPRLGPSGLFQADVDFVRQCKKEIVVAAIPVSVRSGVPEVEVQLNGKLTTRMVWDSGATLVSLNFQTAKSIGLTPSDHDPKIELTTANGQTVTGTLMEVDSIQVGAFTVHHVQCAVCPPDAADAPNLLGGTFQSHFLARLDMANEQLHLTPLEKEESSPTAAPGDKSPGSSNSQSGQ